MKCCKFLIVFITLIGCSNPKLQESDTEQVQTIEQLSNEFLTPSDPYKPGAFWCWLNGNMSTTSITRDLEAMKSKGI
ncbi:MAG: hypothetical protein K2U26_15320, partial [Cyclobacteriaceae bacterium]|nr:hypothetical protein [Cyclobacteriaceae bacterium]